MVPARYTVDLILRVAFEKIIVTVTQWTTFKRTGFKTTKLPICPTPTDLLFYNLPASVKETHARRNLAFYVLVWLFHKTAICLKSDKG